MRVVLLFILLFSAHLSLADQIILHNGDVIEGAFKGIEDDAVLWHSAHFGDLVIKKTWVANIHSTASFKLRGQGTPCVWQGLKKQKALFVCQRGEIQRFPLLSLKHVVLYEGYEKANYAYAGSLRVSGLQKSGNVQSEYWEVHTAVTLRHSDLRHSMQLATSGQKLAAREGNNIVIDRNRRNTAQYVLDWFFLPQYYWSNTLSAEQDENRNIQEEYKMSTGLGYQFWESEATALSSVLGFEHNRTYLELNPPLDEPDAYTSIRVGTDFRYKFKAGVNIYHNIAYSRSLDRPRKSEAQRWEVKSNTGVNLPIGFGVSADVNLEWNYKNHAKDQDPNAFKKDTIYRVGVNYKW